MNLASSLDKPNIPHPVGTCMGSATTEQMCTARDPMEILGHSLMCIMLLTLDFLLSNCILNMSLQVIYRHIYK